MHRLTSWLNLPVVRRYPSLDTELIGPRVLLRRADAGDWKTWRALRELSRKHLMPWEPLWPADATSYSFYTSLLRRQWRDWRACKAFSFSIFRHEGASQPLSLIGGITLCDVQFGAAQKGTVGYWLGSPFTRQGYMTEALGLLCGFAFDTLRLQRVEASCMPRNEASKAALIRAGFTEEGFARDYLQINGVREDHLLWGRTNPNAKTKTAAPMSSRLH